jgi:hypothetical protein
MTILLNDATLSKESKETLMERLLDIVSENQNSGL